MASKTDGEKTPEPKGDFVSAELDALVMEGPAGEPEAPLDGGPRTFKVLVVDDNKDLRDGMRCMLENQGYEILAAGDGVEGLRQALMERPDLVLLDYNLPLMNGYELLQELRRDFDLRSVPVIMFTGRDNRGDLKELPLHVAAFLEKPMSNHHLLMAVHEALGDTPSAPVAPDEVIRDARPMTSATGSIDEAERESGLELMTHDSPLINCVNQILLDAVALGASDIHIEPQEKEIAVRVRLNGTLSPLRVLPSALGARLSARIKILSNLVITERRLPQDGQFRITAQDKTVEFRVSILPSLHGEKIVLRLLGSGRLKATLSDIGFNPRDLGCVENAIQSQNGLILLTGPTGSGKTTTLYTLIAALNHPGINIMTAEDPVEYQVPGITQVPIKPAIGLTFETALRTFLRQDPDVMLIGEIRDLVTAEIAVSASITGHLVLSTVHTNSAPATITRLTQMGIRPFLAADSLKIVIAQRLLKRLCPNCKLPAPLSDIEKRLLTPAEQAPLREVYRGVGCSDCGQTGYAGRRPIFEVMPIRTPEMRRLILAANDDSSLTALAVSEGMSSLRRSALELAASGETSLSEALKIVLSE